MRYRHDHAGLRTTSNLFWYMSYVELRHKYPMAIIVDVGSRFGYFGQLVVDDPNLIFTRPVNNTRDRSYWAATWPTLDLQVKRKVFKGELKDVHYIV